MGTTVWVNDDVLMKTRRGVVVQERYRGWWLSSISSRKTTRISHTVNLFINLTRTNIHTLEQGVTDWMRPRMCILMALSGYYFSQGIICSLVCVILTARIIMAVTHQWRNCWTFTAQNIFRSFTLHLYLKMMGQQSLRDPHQIITCSEDRDMHCFWSDRC